MKYKIPGKESGFQVHIEKTCWERMHGWCKAASSECSGMGLAYIDHAEKRIVVYDVFFPKQYCSPGYTEIDDRAQGKLVYRLHKQNVDPTHFRFWWHTHYNFGTFWSGTDDNNAQNLAATNGEWELSLVINQKGEFLCRFDMKSPFDLVVDELPIYLIKDSRKRYKMNKTEYKRDVERYVLPMDKMPDYQKPKFSSRVEEGSGPAKDLGYNFPKFDFNRDWGGHKQRSWENDDWKPWWLKKEQKEAKAKDKDKCGCGLHGCTGDKCFVCPNGACMNRVRYKGQSCKKCKENPKEDKTAGIEVRGTYVSHGGALIRYDKYLKIKDCLCVNNGCDTCKSILEDKPLPDEDKTAPLPGMEESAFGLSKDCPCGHDGDLDRCKCIKECDFCYSFIYQGGGYC